MAKVAQHKANRLRRKQRIRSTINGTAECPRLTVFKSNTSISAQLIDDTTGKTLVSASEKGGNIAAATKAGQELAKKATDAGIKACVFDRNGYIFHGKVKALADAAREGGLQF